MKKHTAGRSLGLSLLASGLLAGSLIAGSLVAGSLVAGSLLLGVSGCSNTKGEKTQKAAVHEPTAAEIETKRVASEAAARKKADEAAAQKKAEEAKAKKAELEKLWLTVPKDLAPPADAEKTRSGLASKVLAPGEGGPHPTEQDAVLVDYTVWSDHGRRIDSSIKRGAPRVFRVGRQIAGWREGLQLMTVGERRRLWIPERLAYKGKKGKPQGTLIWDAELLEIRSPDPTPPDVARPPKDAQRTASGLAWKMLSPGEGAAHPGPKSAVSVHYTGWTTDGKAFDSSKLTGAPAQFRLDEVIVGWTEGIQLMKKGEKCRFWIPKDLAYKGKKGKPKGTLVFDVELLDFRN